MDRSSPTYRPVSSGRAAPRRRSARSWEGARPRLSVGFLLARNFTLTPLSSFLDVLRLAADEGDGSRQIHCRWTVMGLGREPVRSSCGLDTVPWDDLRDVRDFDYIVVVGGLLDEGPQLDTTTQAYLREAAARGVTLVGICTGTFALVEAGVMTGHQCCVSWYHHRDFANRFPDHPFVANQLFLVDRDRITCSGGTAAADLAAYLIDRHVGGAVAQKAMHILLAERMRSPGQAQPQPPSASPVTNERVRKATLLMEQNLSTTLSVREIAKRVQLSIRQLDRLFRGEMGMSPLSCCGAAVVPVRSPTGWQFFRHKPGTGCAARESLAHIVCKSVMARAADRLGLEVTTEARADDGTWRADVLVRHPGWAVALEAQLSRIPLAAIAERQERYRQAGIRGAWLVGYGIAGLEARRDLPLFRLEVKRAGDIEPAVIGPQACTGLGSFTELLLTGHVRFEGPPARAGAPSVATVRSVCWRCRRDIDLVVALANVPAHAVFAPRGIVLVRDLGKLPGVLAAYRSAIPTLHTACGSLTTLRPPPPSRIAAGLRAHCPWCDAPISLHELPAATLSPRGWRRCWSLAGEAWVPSEPQPPRWIWSGPAG